ncbi:MAG: hypothetical protein WC595_00895 [Candidatus Nanoarchaeia archaeon]
MELTTEKIGKIEWGDFRSNFFVLEVNDPADLLLTEWVQIKRSFGETERNGLAFKVLEIDGKRVDQSFETCSKRLIRLLKPLVEEAELNQRREFRVRIIRTGGGYDTRYSVKKL